MWLRSAIVFLIISQAVASVRMAEAQAPERQKRVLLLGQKADGHPATTHEYMAGVRLLSGMLSRQTGLQTLVIQADSPWTDGPELLDGADGCVLFLSEGAKWFADDPNRLTAFQRLAKRGGVLTCLHWGMGTREAQPVAEFAALFGGCHGGPDRKYQVVSVTATAAANRHPILAGMAPFEVRDEFYYAIKRPAAERIRSLRPLLTVPIDGVDEMVSWACERADGGRSFGFSGLHFHSNWSLPQYRRLVLQGIAWTLNQPIPAEGLDVEVPEAAIKLPESKPEK